MSRSSASQPNRQPFDFWRLTVFLLTLAIVGYVFGRPFLERALGVKLPVIFEESRELAGPSEKPPLADPPAASSRPKAKPDQTTHPPSAKEVIEPPGAALGGVEPTWKFQSLGRQRVQSPAGLIYDSGPNQEHRVTHVLLHSRDDPQRETHGVFSDQAESILELIDEAYRMIQAHSPRVERESSAGRDRYLIEFDRPIGFEGGRSGKRRNYPQLSRLCLVLENGNEVITAYPRR